MQRDDLQYGSFGHATYDVDRSNWQFRRSTQKSLSLRQLGQPQIIVDKSSCTDDERFSDGAKAVRHSRQIKTLVKMHPEVHPAADVLPALARVSEAVIEATRRHDPTKGNLLAVGKITDQGVQRTAEIAAFPDGPTGSDVRIMQLQSQRQGWSDTRRAWLEVPIFSGEEATWKGLGAPIQSLTFSRPINHGHGYLVARLPTKLVFFRPVLRPAAVRSATRLDVNAVAELQIAATGHSPHADVAFDPWHTRHFAVVDDIGNLSLWKLGRNETGKVAQICSGSLNEASENRPVHLFRDGWARIAWTYDYTMIAVCNRHLLRLFDISDQSFVERVSINSDFDGFILDMISVRSGLDHLCVLTSTYIVMFRQHRDIENEPVMDRVAQIRHHMNPDDISLRLRTFEGDKDLVILIRSEVYGLSVSITLHFIGDSLIQVDDPCKLDLTNATSTQLEHLALQDFYLSPAPYGRSQGFGSDDCVALRLQKRGVEFYSLITLYKALSVRQSLTVAARRPNSLLRVELPSWRRAFYKSAAKAVDDDDFIVDDDGREPEENDVQFNEPASAYLLRRKAQAEAISEDEWTVSYRRCVEPLNDVDVSSVTEVDVALEEIRDIFQTPTAEHSTPWKTAKELAEGEITVSDLHRAATHLANLVSGQGRPSVAHTVAAEETADSADASQMVLQSIALPPSVGLPGLEDPFDAFYHLVSSTFATGPYNTVPELVQLTKEQLALRMAAALALASQVIRPKFPAQEQMPESQVQSQSQTWELPLRSGQATSSRTTPSIYFDASNQPHVPALPTPSASVSGARSNTTGSSFTSTYSSNQVARLSRYTTFSADKATPPPLPRRLNRVLAHWIPGNDPTAYDYRSTKRTVSQREDEEADDEGLTEKERARLQKRTERYMRRQRREAEESQRLQMLSSQAPEVISASSQPNVVTRSVSQQMAGSSQTTAAGYSQLPASQVLPGRHGGRPPRKKRKSGF